MDLNSKRAADVYRAARRRIELRMRRFIETGEMTVRRTREFCEQCLVELSAAKARADGKTWGPQDQAMIHCAQEWLAENPPAGGAGA